MVPAWSPDRRRGERREVPFPLYARLALTTVPDDAPRRVRVNGLSVGGIVIESDALLPAGQQVSLTIAVPSGDIGPLTGRVVHSRLMIAAHPSAPAAYVAGVAFESLASAPAEAIETLLFSFGQGSAPGGAGHD